MKEVIIQLLQELPSDKIVVRYMMPNGTFTAERMISEINSDSDIGKQYTNDFFRVCRDFLSRNSS
jgi:hypothetical protein